MYFAHTMLPQSARPARARVAALLVLGFVTVAMAQTTAETVTWSAPTEASFQARAGDLVTLEITGTIDRGWHVYGLHQAPDGPTPLRFKLESTDAATAAGDPTETAPQKLHDARFGVVTEFHTGTLSLRLPVRVAGDATGLVNVPVSVRFQLCSDQECRPPRIVRLTVPLEVAGRS